MKTMASQQPFLVLFCILSVCMLVKADQNASINDFVNLTCNRTIELKNLCLSHINSDPRDDLKTSLTGFLTIFVNHSITDINNDILFLKKELNSNKIGHDTKDMYIGCSDNYVMGLGDLQETLQKLQKKGSVDVFYSLITQTYDLLTGCMEDFEGISIIPPEWQSRYKASYALLDLSLSMINLIKCNSPQACNK